MTDKPTPTKIERSAPMKVTGRLKQAIDAMIWQGLTRQEAAEHAKLKEHSLYVAFRKPHVRAYYLAELGALRTSARAKNFHHLEKIAAESANDMARVSAVKAMEALEDDVSTRSQHQLQSPGLTIVINSAPIAAPLAPPAIEQRPPPLINVTPRAPTLPAPRQAAYEAPAEPEYVPSDPAEPEYVTVYRDLAEPPRPYSAPRDMGAAPKLPGEVGYRAPTPPRTGRNRRR
jgi:hypothetical protein